MMSNDNQWTAMLQDAILENSALRDGLSDDEAQPFIDWGYTMAAAVTADVPEQADPDARYEALYEALPKLMTRINWVALHREKKGAEWTAGILHKLNELNIALHGDAAPQLSEAQINTYANMADGLPRGALVQSLMGHLTPQPPENNPPQTAMQYPNLDPRLSPESTPEQDEEHHNDETRF